MNKPYVKKYDEKGLLINPIKNGFYESRVFIGMGKNEFNAEVPMFYPNRRMRRQKNKK